MQLEIIYHMSNLVNRTDIMVLTDKIEQMMKCKPLQLVPGAFKGKVPQPSFVMKYPKNERFKYFKSVKK